MTPTQENIKMSTSLTQSIGKIHALAVRAFIDEIDVENNLHVSMVVAMYKLIISASSKTTDTSKKDPLAAPKALISALEDVTKELKDGLVLVEDEMRDNL